MLTIDEARKIQSSRQKTAVAKFLSVVAVLAVMAVFAYFYIQDGRVFGGVAVLIFFIAVWFFNKSRFYMMLRPKEFTGTVTSVSAKEEHVRRPSHILYTTEQVIMMEIKVKNNNGRTILHKFNYTDDYKDLKEGNLVTVLRFIDRPAVSE